MVARYSVPPNTVTVEFADSGWAEDVCGLKACLQHSGLCGLWEGCGRAVWPVGGLCGL